MKTRLRELFNKTIFTLKNEGIINLIKKIFEANSLKDLTIIMTLNISSVMNNY